MLNGDSYDYRRFNSSNAQASAESLIDQKKGIYVTFIQEENGGPCTIIRYSFDVPIGRYITDPTSPAVADPSIPALDTTLSAWRSVGIEPVVTGMAISNIIDKRRRRTWTIQPGNVQATTSES